MNHNHCGLDIDELLGAYALNAVSAEERLLVEAHLDHCDECRTEVIQHCSVAALLAPPEPACDEIWDRLVAALEDTPPPLELAPVVALADRRRRSVRVLAGMTAAAAAVIAILGFRVVDQDRRLDGMQSAMAADDVQSAALAALASPAATTVDLRTSEGEAAAQVAVLPDGRGYLLADGLPALAADRTYQLWALIDGERISAGTLGTAPTAAAFHVGGKVEGFALTEEDAGGVVASKNGPVLIGWLRTA
ncbi:MAG: anti-sigma factor domain-containing protein [Acidimicrobiia bacterium]